MTLFKTDNHLQGLRITARVISEIPLLTVIFVSDSGRLPNDANHEVHFPPVFECTRISFHMLQFTDS
jgi:hypothetical protein